MYRLTYSYCNTETGFDHDYYRDLDYSYSLSEDNLYIFENLDFDMVLNLLNKYLIALKHGDNGNILINFIVEE